MKMKIACIAGTAFGLAAAANAQMINHNMGAAGKPVAHAQAKDTHLGHGDRVEIIAALEYDGVGTWGSAAQDFEAAFDCYDISVIEDFSISQDADLTAASAVGFSNGGNPFAATDFRVTIWSDNGSGFPCDASYTGSIVATSDAGAGFWDGIQMNTTFTGDCLPAGSYFIEYATVLDFNPHGQVFFFQQHGAHTVGGGGADNGQHWNPGGCFGLGVNCSQLLDDVGVPSGGNFVLEGEPGDCGGGGDCFFQTGCPADVDGDGDADVQDFFGYLDLFGAGDPCADVTDDGSVDVQDFFQYLDLFDQGC